MQGGSGWCLWQLSAHAEPWESGVCVHDMSGVYDVPGWVAVRGRLRCAADTLGHGARVGKLTVYRVQLSVSCDLYGDPQ